MQLQLYREFVVQVGKPLDLPPAIHELFWKYIIEKLSKREVVCSRDGLNSVVGFLCKEVPIGQYVSLLVFVLCVS